MIGDILDAAAAGDHRAADELVTAFRSAEPSVRTEILDGLARRAAGGSPSALELLLRLVDEHRLDRVAVRRILVDDDQADDAHQDVLIALARSVHRFRSEAAFTTWLHTLARNTAVDHLRRRRATVPLGSDLDLDTAARRMSSMVAVRTDVRAAVAALPEHYRDVVVLRDLEQRSYREIADRLGLELNTVKSRLNRARALLAAAIGDATGPVGPVGPVGPADPAGQAPGRPPEGASDG